MKRNRVTVLFLVGFLSLLLTSAALSQNLEVEVRKGVEFAVHDGVSLRGDLYAPKPPGKYPAIVAVHGGGWQIGNPATYGYWGPYLASRGYVLFAVTYRLCKPGQKTYPEAVHDVRAAVQFVKHQAAELKVDAERVVLMGDSAGAQLASLVALAGDHPKFSNAYRNDPYSSVKANVTAVVGIYGVYDMAAQWNHDQVNRPRDQITEKFIGATPMDDRQVFFDASPISYTTLANNKTAFFLVWGTEDDIVDVKTQSEAFLLALKQARFSVRTAIIQSAPHFWMWDPIDEPDSHCAFLAPRLLRFLRFALR
jgi:acetyl esterase/lipase